MFARTRKRGMPWNLRLNRAADRDFGKETETLTSHSKLQRTLSSECGGLRTRPCEGRGLGSPPGEDTRFITPEPDGQATACRAVEVGSTPTGVFSIGTGRSHHDLPARLL